MKILKGQRVFKPPFWEVWFNMNDFCKRRYGDYSQIENKIAIARDLEMAAVYLGVIDSNVGFGFKEETRDGSRRYGGGRLVSLEQLKERNLPDWDIITEQFRKDIKIIKDAGLVCWCVLPWCFHAAATSMGLENFAFKYFDDISFIEKVFDWIEERNRLAIENVIKEAKPDFVLFDGDCCYKNGLMINPDMFRRFVFERTAETVSHLNRLNIPYTFHSDGKVDQLIPVLIELGFSAFHGCEKAANDLEELVDRFGDDIALVGNMDVVFLSQAGQAEICSETMKMLEIGSRKGRFAASCNTSPQDYIPDENYLAMVETIKNYSKEH